MTDTIGANSSPRWLKDLFRFLPLKSQFVLSGNVRDLQLTSVGAALVPEGLLAHLGHQLVPYGYRRVIAYEPFRGFRVVESAVGLSPDADEVYREFGIESSAGRAPAGIEALAQAIERLAAGDFGPVALIVDFSSRLLVRPDSLSSVEHQAFTRALIACHQARARPFGQPPRPFFNTVLWIVDKESDLPDWFLIGNPRIRHVPISRPDAMSRRALGQSLIKTLAAPGQGRPEDSQSALDELVESTEGLLLGDLAAIVQLGRSEALSIREIGDAVRRYKVGVTEDPWSKIDRRKIGRAHDTVSSRVRGQPRAVTHVLDIVKRAITGVGASRRGGRPRGVAFLAGPTGVGKTELAKTVTDLLFGDESAYIRFDMSEFSAEHADQRLIGAPPGYVGYDVGGELTNAIREKPFSVVLFDEIEKAHPRILDKFLQVLDDGVLTSGRGDRVYFSEAFIIFTSNLGIYKLDSQGERVLNIQPSEPFEEIERRVRAEIDQHFKVVLNRPEILNRIGENIVVFDFIREDVAVAILDSMVSSILRDLEALQKIRVGIADQAMQQLRGRCLRDLSNGGRGIRNQVEVHLINPLARSLFDAGSPTNSSFQILSFDFSGNTAIELVPLS